MKGDCFTKAPMNRDFRFAPTCVSWRIIVRNVQKILNESEKTTAIFAYNDLMAIYVMKALKDAGVRIPDEIALVGYDNIAVAEFLSA